MLAARIEPNDTYIGEVKALLSGFGPIVTTAQATRLYDELQQKIPNRDFLVGVDESYLRGDGRYGLAAQTGIDYWRPESIAALLDGARHVGVDIRGLWG